MAYQLIERQAAPGVGFHAVCDDRFKTALLSVNFCIPLDREKAAGYAVAAPLLRKKSQEYPDFTLLNRKLCDMYGASLDAEVRKIGGWQVVSLSIRSIDNRYVLEHEDLTRECAALLCSLITKPYLVNECFEESEVELERQNLIDMIESKVNDKRSYAIDKCEEYLYAQEPYGIDEYGTVETARTVTPQSATQAYHDLMRRARIEILFVGHGEAKNICTVFEQAFAGIERAPVAVPDFPRIAGAQKVREHEERMDVIQSKLVMGFRTGTFADSGDLSAMRLMVAIFGGTAFSRLFVHVREEKSLCYYCAARFDRIKGVMLVDSGVQSENRPVAQQEILHQLDIMRQDGFTEEEFEAAKLSMKNAFSTVTDSPAGLESWYLVQVIAGTHTSPEEEGRRIAQVTREQVAQAAKKVTLDTVYFLTGTTEGEEQA